MNAPGAINAIKRIRATLGSSLIEARDFYDKERTTWEQRLQERIDTAAKIANPHPMCDKLTAVAPVQNELLKFLDWLREQGLEICTYSQHNRFGGSYRPVLESNERMLYRYLEIDAVQLENERRSLLETIRKSS